jgi:hypothetical protein
VATLLAGLAVLTLGGCKVATPQREPASPKVKEVLDARRAHFDLTRPPTREELGMPARGDEVVYQRADTRPIEVRVSLPQGEDLVVSARLITADSASRPDAATAPPSTMDLHTYPATLEEGYAHMLAAARRFGFDGELIRKWHDEAMAPRPTQAPPTVSAPWMRTRIGYLGIEVQARYAPPVQGEPGTEQTTVHYLLTWEDLPS